MVHRDYQLRSRRIAAIGPSLPPRPPPSYTPAQLAKNQILAGIPNYFPIRRTRRHDRSRGLNRSGNECYRLAALQCLLHLPRALSWFRQHNEVLANTDANPRVKNPCHLNPRNAVTGVVSRTKQNCMACNMRGLISQYWGDHQMNGEEPQPLNPSDARLRLIYNYSTTDDRFAPDGQGVDPQCDAEEWMTYFLDQCQQACDPNSAPDWRPGYQALFQFEFEEERFCSVCDTPISRRTNDPASSFKQPSIGFINCPIDRASPGTVADAINAQLVEHPSGGAGIRRNCSNCGANQLLTRRFRIDAAPEYMLVKFNPAYDDTPPREPGSEVPPPIMRKITNKAELPGIDERLDLTHCQVNSSTKLEYKLVAVLPHSGEVGHGHWIATVRNHPRWYNINDGSVNQVPLNFALSNPEVVPTDWNGTKGKKAKKGTEFQVVVLMYARVR